MRSSDLDRLAQLPLGRFPVPLEHLHRGPRHVGLREPVGDPELAADRLRALEPVARLVEAPEARVEIRAAEQRVGLDGRSPRSRAHASSSSRNASTSATGVRPNSIAPPTSFQASIWRRMSPDAIACCRAALQRLELRAPPAGRGAPPCPSAATRRRARRRPVESRDRPLGHRTELVGVAPFLACDRGARARSARESPIARRPACAPDPSPPRRHPSAADSAPASSSARPSSGSSSRSAGASASSALARSSSDAAASARRDRTHASPARRQAAAPARRRERRRPRGRARRRAVRLLEVVADDLVVAGEPAVAWRSSQSARRACSRARSSFGIEAYATSRISTWLKRKPSSPG